MEVQVRIQPVPLPSHPNSRAGGGLGLDCSKVASELLLGQYRLLQLLPLHRDHGDQASSGHSGLDRVAAAVGLRVRTGGRGCCGLTVASCWDMQQALPAGAVHVLGIFTRPSSRCPPPSSMQAPLMRGQRQVQQRCTFTAALPHQVGRADGLQVHRAKQALVPQTGHVAKHACLERTCGSLALPPRLGEQHDSAHGTSAVPVLDPLRDGGGTWLEGEACHWRSVLPGWIEEAAQKRQRCPVKLLHAHAAAVCAHKMRAEHPLAHLALQLPQGKQ